MSKTSEQAQFVNLTPFAIANIMAAAHGEQ